MSDLVKDLPAEYRTPSLESLPKALQPMVVKQIRKKFGLKEQKPIRESMQALLNDTFTTASEAMMRFYDTEPFVALRRYKVCIEYNTPFSRLEHEDIYVDTTPDTSLRYVEEEAVHTLRRRYGGSIRLLRVKVLNG